MADISAYADLRVKKFGTFSKKWTIVSITEG